jgi:putative two-component system response regulator
MERTSRLERLNDEILVTLAAAVDARDPYTHGHSMRVSIYADALAVAAGLDAVDREAIKRGCMVHDIGKIGVPDSILRKAGPLDDKERVEMRRHPIVGHRLVSGMPWDRIVLDIVLHHHERWDGDGYPAGLAGEAIPRVARLVAIADTLDAMTSRRPYRAAYSFRRAADEIAAQAGRQFDSVLIAVLKTHRREMAQLVAGALQVWVPRVVRKRQPQGLAVNEVRLKVVS